MINSARRVPARADDDSAAWRRYEPPAKWYTVAFEALLAGSGRAPLADKQLDLLRASKADRALVMLYCAGSTDIIKAPTVSIVGTRDVSPKGYARAQRLARELVGAGVTVMSGLAAGVDAAAHTAAIEAGGKTAAVIGTPLTKAYPAANAELQEEIYRHHLLVSPFAAGEQVFKANFPKRNRIMAALSDATVIIEASDTSGTLHQAAECQRLGRWLFIAQSVIDDPSLRWPQKFLGGKKTAALTATADVVRAITNDKA